jgi:hypothetical protein
MSLELSVKQLNELIEQKRLVDGIEAFYAEDVAMVENGQAMVGREVNRNREHVFESGLTKWDARLVASAVDEKNGTALNQWLIDYDHAQFGAGTLNQVAVQQWQNGRIVRETFYKI